jgi:hypothetical protein
MKSNDEILKYLSDLMTEKEKSAFEIKLASSEELQNELAKHKNILGSFNLPDESEDGSFYFQNILPRVRAKIEKRKGRQWVPRFAYLIPTVTAVILILLNTGKFTDEKAPEPKTSNTDNVQVTNIDNESILADQRIITDMKTYGIGKKESISFEVGLSSITNKENIKEIANEQLKIPYMEDYLLALK